MTGLRTHKLEAERGLGPLGAHRPANTSTAVTGRCQGAPGGLHPVAKAGWGPRCPMHGERHLNWHPCPSHLQPLPPPQASRPRAAPGRPMPAPLVLGFPLTDLPIVHCQFEIMEGRRHTVFSILDRETEGQRERRVLMRAGPHGGSLTAPVCWAPGHGRTWHTFLSNTHNHPAPGRSHYTRLKEIR